MMNRAVSGNPKATSIVLDHLTRADENAAEQQKNSPKDLDQETNSANLTDAQLMMIIARGLDKSGDPEDED